MSCVPHISRRDWLWRAGGGLGGVALAHLLAEEHRARGEDNPHLNGGLHHRAQARRVIQLFMNGGVSQCDTFDYKPELEKRHGQKFDPGAGQRVEGVTSVPGNLMKSPFPFRQYGASGRWVSDALPHLARHVDDLAFLMAVQSRTNVHGPASYLMNTGFLLPGFPCLGAWLSYGLGRLTDDLPTFVALPDARGLPYNGKGNFSAGFLPQNHQGVIVPAGATPPVPDLALGRAGEFVTPAADAEGRALLDRWNRRHAAERENDTRLAARIASYELAARMQLRAPEAFDLRDETAETLRLYGIDQEPTQEFGRRCLLARRLVERGARMVQVWSGAGGPSNNWDNHNNIPTELAAIARQVDAPTAGLLTDLKRRGLLDDTLVVWSTEFGRMPFTQGATGRDHNGGTSVAWLAGAGVRGGAAHGESDEWSWRAARDAATGYDLHATLLHLLGIDHESLSVRHDGHDRRLTDVHGHVLHPILQ